MSRVPLQLPTVYSGFSIPSSGASLLLSAVTCCFRHGKDTVCLFTLPRRSDQKSLSFALFAQGFSTKRRGRFRSFAVTRRWPCRTPRRPASDCWGNRLTDGETSKLRLLQFITHAASCMDLQRF